MMNQPASFSSVSRRAMASALAALPALITLLPVGASARIVAADGPLPSWNDVAFKNEVVVFVRRVTKQGSPVLETEIAAIFGAGGGPLFAVVSETVVASSLIVRLERFGRPEIKNVVLLPSMFDKVNRDLEIRDLYNQEDAFALGRPYLGAYRARMNANLVFYDGLDDEIDWPLDAQGTHPLTELLLADFMVVDVSKPFSKDGCYFEIERMLLKGVAHATCGGRWLNDHSMDTVFTLLVNAGNGPEIKIGVEHATIPALRTFPYLAPPDPNPPQPLRPEVTK
jgi:hypothetical protein